MDINNLAYLQDKLKYLGFGEEGPLHKELADQLAIGAPEFELYTEIFYEDCRMEIKLLFIKTVNSERYFFQKYDALLRYSDDPQKDKAQTIPLYKGRGFTVKETYNLLQGRAVYKEVANVEDQRYYAWSQLDFTQKTQNDNYRIKEFKDGYSYDLEKVLAKYPILELETEEIKVYMIRALQRGNKYPVCLIKNKKRERVFIEANPGTKLVNITYPPSTSAATNDEQSPEVDIPPALLPGPAKKSSEEDEEQEPLPPELETIGVPAEMGEQEEEEEEELATTTARKSRRARIYK